MRKLILKSEYALGDTVLLTAAVRDLHRRYPAGFQTDVRTAFPELWRHNPYLTPLNEYDPDVTVVQCGLPLVQRSNHAGCHSLNGFPDFLDRHLGMSLVLTECRGDIHLSRHERHALSPLRALAGVDVPYWLISAGGRFDNTVKWWDARRYQEVVRHFRGRLQFVQVGHRGDYHPLLEGVIDLRGRTGVRDLVRLVHHAEGVVCGVTGLMHLAAAVPARSGCNPNRPCVVVAGGRESPAWEAYPGHQFLHVVGMLPCCATGGCWRSRVRPLGDGAAQDRPEKLCLDVHQGLPRCMHMITSQDVIRRLEAYLEGGARRVLTPAEARRAHRTMPASAPTAALAEPLHLLNAVPAAEALLASVPPYPGGFQGRGIVICGGGVRMFTNAWVCIRLLRDLGCRLPIQLWHLGRAEVDAAMRALAAPFGVQCVDALKGTPSAPRPRLHGWSLKPYALLHSPFREVMLLDADNVPLANPEFLFETPQFRRTKAIFWPDFGRLGPDRGAWKVFGVPYRDEPEFETGQIVLDKAACWKALNLCMWYNAHSDFFYRFVHGDKETFHMAFRKVGQPYAMPRAPIHPLPATMCQHDFLGRRLFQHRNLAKWSLIQPNPKIRGFLRDRQCRLYLRELGRKWDGRSSLFLNRRRLAAARLAAPRVLRKEVRLAACMVSCAKRQKVRGRTLARLARSDWSGAPLLVVLDEDRFGEARENITHTGWRALREGLRTRADYILYFEDDLDFNRHLCHNLRNWELLRGAQVHFATLYNPGLRELAWDVPRHTIAVEATSYYGAQAALISRPLAEYLLDHWFDCPPVELDMKWKALMLRQSVPLLAHSPSLVQHCGLRSTWGGPCHRAADFLPRWKAAPATTGPPLRFVGLPHSSHP